MAIDLGGTRHLHIDETNEVFIKDLVLMKCAFFTAPCLKRFVGMIAEIDKHVQLASVGKTTKYCEHIGGTLHVSVDSMFPNVNIRRWYEDSMGVLKPSRVGIALFYWNWYKLKNAIDKVHDQIPALVVISPCWHNSQIDLMFCDECSPYHKEEDIDDVKAAEAAENLMIDTDSSTSGILIKCRKML